MMKYLIYKITNKLNGMFYIGKHQTEDINDNYYGSGFYLKRAIKKYGKSNFRKEILFVFDDEKQMNMKERELVNEELVNNPLCYNMMVGGEGGDTWSNTGKHHSSESKKKISEKVRRYIKNSGDNGHRIRSERQKQIWCNLKNNPKELELINKKRSETLKKRIKENPHIRGHKLSEETKKKISESMKTHFKSK